MSELEAVSGSLIAVLPIQSVGDDAPFRIVPLLRREGTTMSAAELMEARVKWVSRVTYRVVTRSVPPEFLPYNAVIRLDERGTEDRDLDYLARIVALPTNP